MLVKKGSKRAKKLPGPIAKRWKKHAAEEAAEEARWAAVTKTKAQAKAERKEAWLKAKKEADELKAKAGDASKEEDRPTEDEKEGKKD